MSSTAQKLEIFTDRERVKRTSYKDLERPCYHCHDKPFVANDKTHQPGLYYHTAVYPNNGAEPRLVDTWLSTPLKVTAVTVEPDGQGYGRLLEFTDMDGNWRKWAMPMRLLAGKGDELRQELLDRGVQYNINKSKHLTDYIMNSSPKKRVQASSQTGWFESNSFVMPDMVIGEGNVHFQSETAAINAFSRSGSADSWQKNIGEKCPGNTLLTLSVSAALAGVLLNKTHTKGAGLHFVGDSSTGKSTVAEVAASVWGPQSFIQSWSATSNGFEGAAEARNDTVMILDEINEAMPGEVGKIAYMLSNGMGKQRSTRTGAARRVKSWRLMLLSTGERTLANIMEQAGKQVTSGQLARLLSIPADYPYGAFQELHGFASGREFADHLKESVQEDYGHIGIEFIRSIIDSEEDLPGRLASIIDKVLPANPRSTESRAGKTFAIIALAGELAVEFGLLPWSKGAAVDAAKEAFELWRNLQSDPVSESEQICQSISDFLSRFGDSRFSPIDNPSAHSVPNRAGYHQTIAGERVYIFTKSGLEEAARGFGIRRIFKALDEAGHIVDRDPGRNTKKTRTADGTENLYWLKKPL